MIEMQAVPCAGNPHKGGPADMLMEESAVHKGRQNIVRSVEDERRGLDSAQSVPRVVIPAGLVMAGFGPR